MSKYIFVGISHFYMFQFFLDSSLRTLVRRHSYSIYLVKYTEIQVNTIIQNKSFISKSNFVIVFAILVYSTLKRVYQFISVYLFESKGDGRGVRTKFLGHSAGWSPLRVKWNWLSTRYNIGWSYFRNLIISLITMLQKILVFILGKINIGVLHITYFELMSLALSVQSYFILLISVF